MIVRRSPRHAPRTVRTPIRTVVLLIALALLAACGAPAPVPGIQLGLGSVTVAVLRGGSVDVDVVLTRTGGASGPVALSATGLPANVEASFAPPTLDGATTTSVLTLTATAAATEGTTSVTVAADGASLSAEATLSVEVESLTIAGRVETLFGIGLNGIAVASQGGTTFTNADGAFELDGLSVPYDVALSAAIGAGALHVFEGLSTAAPTLRPSFALGATLPTARQANVSGDVLGGAAVAADRVVFVCAEGLDRVVLGCATATAADTAYAFNAAWYGPATASVRLHALHLEVAVDDTPAAYLGYEAFDLTLTDAVATVHDLTLTPVASVLVEGSLEAGPGMTVAGLIGGVRFGPRLTMQLFGSTALVADVSVLMPAPAGATYDFAAVANGPDGPTYAWTVDRAGTGFGTLTVPAALVLASPANAALGVTLATPFASTGGDDVRTYLFEGPGPSLAVTTNRDTVTVPDPDLGGFVVPAGDTYSWYVLGHGATDADAALDRGVLDYFQLMTLSSEGGPGFVQDGELKFGTSRTFTFAP